MLGGQESARSTLHLAELIRHANRAGALLNPELAASRAKTVFASRGNSFVIYAEQMSLNTATVKGKV